MGITKLISSSDFDDNDNELKQIITPSPNPDNFDIIDYIETNDNLVIKVRYKDVNNYEGLKILVYRNCNTILLDIQGMIDPHFSQNENYHSPVARFEPTEWGWKTACELAKNKLN